MKNRNVCVLALGMHRSGTSALTRVISLLGATLPKNLMPPALGNNIAGFWEPKKLADLNEAFLNAANSSWDDWHGLDLSVLPANELAAFQDAILECIRIEYGDAPQIVLKDPRICRLVPLYTNVLDLAGYKTYNAIILRNPLEVASSLQRRDGMPSSVAYHLWLRHNLDLEVSTRGFPRAFVSYDSLLNDWRPIVARLGDQLSLNWPTGITDIEADIDNFLSEEHRHFTFSREDLARSVELTDLVKVTYRAYENFLSDPNDALTLRSLDSIRYDFEQISKASAYTKRRTEMSYKARLDNVLSELNGARTKRDALIAEWGIPSVLANHQIGDVKPPVDIGCSLAVPIPSVTEPKPGDPPVAVVAHIFYEELAAEILAHLRNIPGRVDVFISTTSEKKKETIEEVFKNWPSGIFEVRVVPNKGRDISSKYVTFRDVYSSYELILFVHSKRSIQHSFLSNWRTFLLKNLVGSTEVATTILQLFRDNPKLGIVAPQHFELLNEHLAWGPNFETSQNLARKMNIAINEKDDTDFPSGSMFWARSEAMSPLLDLGLHFDDFPEEEAQSDGTIAHAIERLIFYSSEHAGLDWIKIASPEFFTSKSTIHRVGLDGVKSYVETYGRKLIRADASIAAEMGKRYQVNSLDTLDDKFVNLVEDTRRLRRKLEHLRDTLDEN